MKKLDEIMELMSDEMADFEGNLQQLQKLNNELEERSIPISTAALENKLQEFFLNQNALNQQKDQVILDIKLRLDKSGLIPKYILVLFASTQFLLLTITGYCLYDKKIEETMVYELYELISEMETENYQIYFSENPNLKEEYCRWLEQYHK